MRIIHLNNTANWLAAFNLKNPFEEIIIWYDYFEKFEAEKGADGFRAMHAFTMLAGELPKGFSDWKRNEWREYLKKNILKVTDRVIGLKNIIDIDILAIYVVYRIKKNDYIFFAHDLQQKYDRGYGWIVYNQLACSLTKTESEKIHGQSDAERIFAIIPDDRKILVKEPAKCIDYIKFKGFLLYPTWSKLMEEFRVS